MASIPGSVKLQGILLAVFAVVSVVLNYLQMTGVSTTGVAGSIVNGFNISQQPFVGSLNLPNFTFCPLPSFADYAGYITAPMILIGILSLFLGNSKSSMVAIFLFLSGIFGLVAPPMSAVLSILSVLCDLKDKMIYPLKIIIFVSAIIQLSSVFNMFRRAFMARKNAPKAKDNESAPEVKQNPPAVSPTSEFLPAPTALPPGAPLATVPRVGEAKLQTSPYAMNYYPLVATNPQTTNVQAYRLAPLYNAQMINSQQNNLPAPNQALRLIPLTTPPPYTPFIAPAQTNQMSFNSPPAIRYQPSIYANATYLPFK